MITINQLSMAKEKDFEIKNKENTLSNFIENTLGLEEGAIVQVILHDPTTQTFSRNHNKSFYSINNKFYNPNLPSYRVINSISETGMVAAILSPNHSQALKFELLNTKRLYKESKKENEAIISFYFDVDDDNTHKPLEILYNLIELLNQLEGVEAVLEEIKVGSIFGKIKAIFKSKKAKKLAEDTFQDVIEMGKAKLERDTLQNEILKAEKNKLDKENQILNENTKDRNLELSFKEKEAKLRLLELEIENKQIENKRNRIAAEKELLEHYKNLLAEKLITEYDYQIFMDGESLIEVKDSKLINLKDSKNKN